MGTDPRRGRPPGPLSRLVDKDHAVALAAAAGVLLLAGWLLTLGVAAADARLRTAVILFWVALGLGAIHGIPAAWVSIKRLRPDIDVLMVLGAFLAALIGHPEEGALLLFMFTLAGGLEHRAMAKARDAVSRLHKLMPKAALRREGDQWIEVSAEALRPTEVVLVRPGETIPADGRVRTGESHVDQSRLTGESLPRSIAPGDDVFAGTMNQDGAIEVTVTRAVAESSIHKILALVLEAQESRPPMQRLIDRYSTPYAVTVMIGAAVAGLAFLAFGGAGLAQAIYLAITLLVVASPCALVIATPTATLCGLSRAARAGVLVKGGDALERLSGVSQIAMDKTGTLTSGRIEVVRVAPIGSADVDSLLRIALAAEQRSTHPIAAAIVRLAEDHHLKPAELASLSNVPGRGIEGQFEGQPVRIGTEAFCEPLVPVCFRAHTRRLVERVRADGGMPVVVAHRGEVLVLALADQPRPGAERLVEELGRVGVDQLTMLTGDHRVAASRVAEALGITDVRAELLPEQKVEELKRMRTDGISDRGGLAVVGDGVNDAPALAIADVGLAMGAIGADAALETADVVLLHDDISRIPWTIGLAKRARRIMRANLLFAVSVIAVLVALTLLGRMPLGLGVVGHEGSTLLVVANSLRLLGHREPAAHGRG